MRLSTRFVFTPTGPAHIFHAYVARWNRRLAEWTGGSFVYRFENTLAANSLWKWRDDRMTVCRENLEEMTALGLGPTPPATLRDLGFPPGIGVDYQQGRGLADHYWRLWGLEREFGAWPVPFPEGAQDNPEAEYLQAGLALGYALVVHPFVVLARVAEDIRTGRNLILRGEDLLGESALYAMFSRMILGPDRPLPAQAYLPRWSMCDDLGHEIAVSSSDWKPGAPGFIRDVLEAGRTGEELFDWMDRHLVRNLASTGVPIGISGLAQQLRRDPIPLKSWLDFLWAGHRRKQREERGREV